MQHRIDGQSSYLLGYVVVNHILLDFLLHHRPWHEEAEGDNKLVHFLSEFRTVARQKYLNLYLLNFIIKMLISRVLPANSHESSLLCS